MVHGSRVLNLVGVAASRLTPVSAGYPSGRLPSTPVAVPERSPVGGRATPVAHRGRSGDDGGVGHWLKALKHCAKAP